MDKFRTCLYPPPPHSDSLMTSILVISEYWSTYNVNLSLHSNKGNAWVTETFLLIYFQLLGKIFRVNVALCYNPNVNRFLFFIINWELCDIQIRPLISCLTVVTSCLSDTVIPQNWTLHYRETLLGHSEMFKIIGPYLERGFPTQHVESNVQINRTLGHPRRYKSRHNQKIL